MDLPLSFIDGFMARIDGPMSLRLVVQPIVALFLAFRDGRRDAHEERSAYFWALFTEPEHRREMLEGGWHSISKVFIVAVVLDLVFQYLVFQDFRPIGALMAGIVLAIFPYLLLRGPVNRMRGLKAKRTDA
jgi:predicted histidine transporter YuiF (NhaC family)